MPRPLKPPRLWLRKRGQSAFWYILDQGKQIHTGCIDRAAAEKKLAAYVGVPNDQLIRPEHETWIVVEMHGGRQISIGCSRRDREIALHIAERLVDELSGKDMAKIFEVLQTSWRTKANERDENH